MISGSLYHFSSYQGAPHMCMWTRQPTCPNGVLQLAVGSFGLGVYTSGFVYHLEEALGGYTHRLWKRLEVIWAGNSEMLQGLGAWSPSRDRALYGLNPLAMDSSTQEEEVDPSQRRKKRVYKSQSGQCRLLRI